MKLCRDGEVYRQDYKYGDAQKPVKKTGTRKKTGTKTAFYPDPEIFNRVEFKFDIIASRLRELAFLNQGLTIMLRDHRTEKEVEFVYNGGLSSFVEYINENNTVLFRKPIHFHKSKDDVDVEIALQYNDGYSESLHSYVNNINTIEGGTHLTGFRTALTRTINNHATKNKMLKKENFTLIGEDSREGLTAVLSVKFSRKTHQWPKRLSINSPALPWPARPPVRPKNSPAAKQRLTVPPCRVNWPIAVSATPNHARYTSWRVTRLEVPQNRAETAATKPSCHYGVKS